MNLWAKIDVGILRHPMLRGRPDADAKVWLALILDAKEHGTDGVVRGGPAEIRTLAQVKASVRVVSEALAHFVEAGALEAIDGGYRLRDFAARQCRPSDLETGNAARQRRYRERHARVTGTVTSNASVTPTVTQRVTVEEEEEEEKEKRTTSVSLPADGSAASGPSLAELESGWPKELLERVRVALCSTRRSGKMAEGPWRAFLLAASQIAPEKRNAAAETYLDRLMASEGKNERYLLGIMRRVTADEVTGRAPARAPGAAAIRVEPQPEFEGRVDVGRLMP